MRAKGAGVESALPWTADTVKTSTGRNSTLPRIRRATLAVAVFAAALAAAAACSQEADSPTDKGDPRFQPSGSGVSFNPGQYRDFTSYVLKTRKRLERDKVYTDSGRKAVELAAATPFELRPVVGCPDRENGRHRQGILLVHGLSDTPLAMRDLAEAFAGRCFLVRAILLPGHGTRAADLIDVSGEDWLEAVQFGIDTLKQDVDEVYVGGFSLGGLLAVHMALRNPDTHGVFAISPAFALKSAWLLQQSLWIRHLFDWADRDPPDDYARYESMPFNGLAETYRLSETLVQRLDGQTLNVPVFVAQSANDAVIDHGTVRDHFARHLVHPDGRLLLYRRDPQEGPDSSDPRTIYVNSDLPKQRIAGFSHLSLHISPANPHYGIDGDYRNCDDDRSDEAVARCLAAAQPWRGETFEEDSVPVIDGEAMARLTFNPRFDDLLYEIDLFLLRLAAKR